MYSFVLVHGAWHGGWCWKKLAPMLRASGHEVHTPTLTGLGERSHLLNREINLDTHIKDVTNLLEFEDLTKVTLVGHSYGGMVITGVAELVPEHLSHLTYLDAVTPNDGQSMFDAIGDDAWATDFRKIVAEEGEGWLIHLSKRMRRLVSSEKQGIFGVTDPQKLKWLEERLKPHPMATWEQKIHCGSREALVIPKTYIWCSVTNGVRSSDRPPLPEGWGFYEIQTGHDAMLTVPRELAEVLMSNAGRLLIS